MNEIYKKRDGDNMNIVIINEEFSLQRIDNFLFNKLKKIPKSRVYRMIRSGEVRINKKRVRPSYKLQSGDILRIPPFVAKSDIDVTKDKPGDNLIKLLLGAIIFENDEILVINKPAGLACHSGSGINFGVIEILRVSRDDLANLELVHRLDRDTSGCLVLAKKRTALRKLHQLIRDGEVIKKYVLLVKGEWQGGKRVVDAPLLKNLLQSGERMVKVNEEGKKSLTIFRPLKIGKAASLIEAELKTGRTHQIRVHAAHIGYPIISDKKYGDTSFNKEMRARGVKRLALHAEKISFCWESGKKFEFKADEKELKLDDFAL